MNQYHAKNSPKVYHQNTPLIALSVKNDGIDGIKRRYTKSEEIDNLSIDKYHKSGRGIIHTDLLSSGLAIERRQAQNTLKYFRRNGILFTLKDQRPQRYYSSSIRSEIIKNWLSSEKNTDLLLKEPTGVNNIDNKNRKIAIGSDTTTAVPSDSDSTTATTNENIIIQTLEGYVIPLLPLAPLHIHNIHLKTKILADCYVQLDLPNYKRNRGKYHTEVIGSKGQAEFIFYPNGTLEIQVKCSQKPHKLETEEDRSHLLTFFGQLKDRLISLLMDKEEKIVPDIMEWYLAECDINKDIKVSDLLHICGLKIQVKHIDHIFRIYIKSKGSDTICRVEETKHPAKPALEAINELLNPYESVKRN